MPFQPVSEPYRIRHEEIEPGMRLSWLDASGATYYDIKDVDWEHEVATVSFGSPVTAERRVDREFPLDYEEGDPLPWVLGFDIHEPSASLKSLAGDWLGYGTDEDFDINADLSRAIQSDTLTITADVPPIVWNTSSTPVPTEEDDRNDWNEQALYLAGDHGRTVTFTYQKESGPGGVMETRHLVPDENGIFTTRAGNKAVTGHDVDRDDQRAFRLDRIIGYVSVN